MVGVDEPDYGHLLDDMRLSDDRPVPVDRYCAPRIEVEVGFVLGDDLPGEGCTTADVLAATERVVPAIELIDSRIADWRISIADTVADNASSAGYVTGDGRDPRELDLKAIDAVLRRGPEQIAMRPQRRRTRRPRRLRRLAGPHRGPLRRPAEEGPSGAARVLHQGRRRRGGPDLHSRFHRARPGLALLHLR